MATLNFKTFGQGPALIILHGLFGSLDNWLSLGKQFAEYFSVYLVDQRNHGRSLHSSEWSYGVMAEDLHDFMDEQGIFQAHLLGHSMGGKTVMTFASLYPERVDRLVVADMGIKLYPRHHEEVLEAIFAIDLASLETRQEAEATLTEHLSDQVIIQFLLKNLGRDQNKHFQWKFNAQVIRDRYDEVLRPIEFDHPHEGPTLFLTGGKSHYVQPKDHESIQELFPRAIFTNLSDAGHWLHAEQPEAFFAEVQRFLLS